MHYISYTHWVNVYITHFELMGFIYDIYIYIYLGGEKYCPKGAKHAYLSG